MSSPLDERGRLAVPLLKVCVLLSPALLAHLAPRVLLLFPVAALLGVVHPVLGERIA
jgi:hypothetical protein